MMRVLRFLLKVFLFVLGVMIAIAFALMVYVRSVSKVTPPNTAGLDTLASERRLVNAGLFKLGDNWFRKSKSGLYELYVEGEPYERGLAIGELTQELVQYQEEVFTDQIHQLVPSDLYLEMLKYFVGWFNRDLEDHVIGEYKLEIYGVSKAASHEFDDIAPPYGRILNYHAAHDIGHALQNMSLVGCTSFATWGGKSEDGSLIVGRNFDFYVGDEFARDKIVAFYNPAQGYKFVMITFGGMTGVLSGMNDQGLTVTINAAKSDIPSASATPVSLVAREILQYASTIEEAYTIANKRKMFVAESFLIGSAKEKRAEIIEKSPDSIGRFKSGRESIVCANHFQSQDLGNTELNKEHVRTSASPYRYQRVEELLEQNGKNSVSKTANILRNKLGLGGRDIGLGNEKSINQLVAHHAVIFKPEELKIWISTAPWQLGEFVCYDLNKVFADPMERDHEIYEELLSIPADDFLNTPAYKQYLKFHAYRFPFSSREGLDPDEIVRSNPNSYHAYMLAGDACFSREAYSKAAEFYKAGLTKEIATEQERFYMEKNLNAAKEKLK